MGIFRATKHKSLFKLSAAVFLLSAALVGGILSLGHASAATAPTPKSPLTWTDSSHASIADGSKNVYTKVGYSCLNISNGVYTLLSSLSPTTIDCYHIFSESSKVFLWETGGTPKYALAIIPFVDGSNILPDPGTCTLDLNSCKASVWTINGTKLNGTSSSTNSPILSNFVIGGVAASASQQTPPGSDGSATPTCESSGTSLSWIMCPIINMLSSAIHDIYVSIIQPLLYSKPISLNSSDFRYKTWSNFRIYGDIFLVIALLVVVFSQSIGGGLIDAYSAKKILPRLLIAAVLINLSYYLVAFAVDITNILGNGIQTLLSQPFVGSDPSNSGFILKLNGGTSGAIGGAGLLAGAAGIWAVSTGIGAMLQFLLVFVLLPAFFAFLAILAVVIIRQGLIILLLVVSPIAFALYCLPNTEQYFRKWWDLLFRTLLVYPIIAVVFSIANILSVTINQASLDQGGALASLSQLMSVIALVIPMFLIPFSFKVAGGIIGKFHEVTSGLGKKGHETIKGHANDPTSLRNSTRTEAKRNMLQARGIAGQKLTSSNSFLKRKAGRVLYTPKTATKLAITNAEAAQSVGTIWSSGDDSFVKASTIPLSVLDDRKAIKQRYRTADAVGNTSGVEQWQTADGAWYSKDQIVQGNREYRNDSAKQFNYKKMLEKTEQQPTENQDKVLTDYLALANEEGWDENTAKGGWAGIAIPAKHIRLDLRRAKIGGSPGQLRHTGIDNNSLLEEYANMTPGDQIKETPESFGAIRNAVYQTLIPNPTVMTEKQQKDQNILDKNAAKAYKNLERFVKAPPMDYYDTESQGAVPGSPQSTSSAAAAKNAEAARLALANIQNNPELLAKLNATWEELGGEIGNI